MIEPKTICIVGFGLMGGSLGKALKENTEYTVLAIDQDPEILKASIEQNAADKSGGSELLSVADVIVLALSPQSAKSFLSTQAGNIKKGAIVTDLCGVKRSMVAVCEEICIEQGLFFIGGHPMAGKEHSGFENSDSKLFQGASYILTPTEKTPPEVTAFMMKLAVSIGCKTTTITTPENHDRMIAFTSQLPHVLAGSYVKSLAAVDHKGYSAGSFRDVSRVATIDEELWCELFLENGDYLCNEIDQLIDHLLAYKSAILSSNENQLKEIIQKGREIKLAISN